MDYSIFVVVLLGTVIGTFGEYSEEKRLLLSDPTHVENEIQQLKSLVTTLTAKFTTLEFDLTTTKSALSSANTKLTLMKSELSTLDARLNVSNSALAAANSKLGSYDLEIADLKSKCMFVFKIAVGI